MARTGGGTTGRQQHTCGGNRTLSEERFPFVRDELIAIATAEGFDGEVLWERSRSDAIAESYANNTRQSIDRNVFGMPFYIVDGQPYWGQDRLELIEYQLSHS